MRQWYIYDAIKNKVLEEHPFRTKEECQASIDNSVQNYKRKIDAEETVGNIHVSRKMKRELSTVMECHPIYR